MAHLPPTPRPSKPALRVVFGTVASGMPGGIPVTETSFQHALAATGQVEVRVLPFGRRRPDESALERMLTGMGDLAGYASTVLRERPDVVHLNTAFDPRALVRDLGYVAVSRALGQKLFLKMHGSQEKLLRTRSRFWRWMAARVVRGADGIGVLSSEEKRLFTANGFEPGRFHVVPNAVDAGRFERAKWPRPGRTKLLFIARMVEGKGLPEVIEMMGVLCGQGRDVELVCVGDGPERRPQEARARDLGISDRVTFTGFVPETATARFYLESSMLVFPSAGEGFSMTVFQSLAAGLPIVTTQIRAAADHLREPDHCLWVPPHDPEKLAERVGWLLDHPEVMAAMSRANRDHASRFVPSRVADDYIAIYRALAGEGRRAAHPLSGTA